MTNRFIRYSLRQRSLTAGLTIACSALNAQAGLAATAESECLTENELSDFSRL
ncbi:hypothetical protein GGR01_003541 [Acetobacter oeni]|nr:hypothetical protein [Acetobacter oeni]